MNGIIYIHGFVLIVGIIIVFVGLFQSGNQNEENEITKPYLLITILSARPNFSKREAVRKSWAKVIKEFKNINYKFFIGKECPIPLLDRLDELSCIGANNINKELQTSLIKKFWGNLSCSGISHRNQDPFLLTTKSCYSGFGFQVVHPLTLNSIGVQWELIDNVESLVITFKDPEEVFENIFVDRKSCSVIQSKFCFVNVKQQLLLPKYFEGEISLSIKGDLKSTSERCFWTTDDCLRFTFGKTENYYEKYQEGKCSYVIANFSLSDEESLTKHVIEKPKRCSDWNEEQMRVEAVLISELEKYDDIVYLPNITDVYRNLPLKVLEVFKWVRKNYPKSPVFKVDDDTYLDAALLTKWIPFHWLEEESLSIWSHFYHHRAVPLFGKWADYEFQSLTYPPFPSGSGYLVSGNLVSLLAQQASFLRPFQGEDISIGIWTEVLRYKQKTVQKFSVRCWLPSSVCNESILVPELTPQQMMDGIR